MPFIDGMVVAVPTANRDAYRSGAEKAAQVFQKHGATRIVENWGADVPKGEMTDFHRAVQAKDDETVVFSWIEWPDKGTRDAGMQKAMEELQPMMSDMPFDGKRMIYGGFESIFDTAMVPA